jgi:catechol 2,3-dioxygenase-like lactoylglutathione lyase family enzyme
VIDCPDPRALADFYCQVLGMRINEDIDGSVVIGCGPGLRQLAFQRAADWIPPRWPDPAYPQQMHLDIRVSDADQAEQELLALGATRVPGERETASGFSPTPSATRSASFRPARHSLNRDEDEPLAFYDYPAEPWIHLRTTNPDRVHLRRRQAADQGHQRPRVAGRRPGHGVQACRVRPVPLADGQRAAPGRARPDRSDLHRRQARWAAWRGRPARGRLKPPCPAMTSGLRGRLHGQRRETTTLEDPCGRCSRS